MKKIYLLALSILLGNAVLFASGFQGRDQNTGSIQPGTQKNGSKTSVNLARHGVTGVNYLADVCAPYYLDDFDGLNNVADLEARGYITHYRGGGPPGATATWFQGNPTVFPSWNGPDSGYVASNYQSVTATNDIDNWMILPALNIAANDVIGFYSQSPFGSTAIVDTIKVMYSAAGDTLPEDLTWVLLGEFQVSVAGWEYKEFVIPAAGTVGRLAIRYAIVQGGPGSLTNSNYSGVDHLVVFTPSPLDAGINRISSPATDCGLTATETVSVVVANNSTTAISNFGVSYSINAGTPVVETITASIQPGDTLTYNFTATADLSAVGSYAINTLVNLTGDGGSCNDTMSTTVVNSTPADPSVTVYTMGFEDNEDLSSWFVQDVDGDGVTWAVINSYPHTGTNSIRKAASSAADDDWLFTGCLDLIGGALYRLEYWYKAFDLVAICGLESYIATAQDYSTVTSIILQNATPTDTVYQQAIDTISVLTSGTYYLAFHATSGAGTSAIRIDDINLDGTFIGVPETGSENILSIFPNPSTGSFYIDGSQSAKNILVEAFNATGQLVYSTKVDNLNHQLINLDDQANGVYSIKISTDSFVKNQTVVVNR